MSYFALGATPQEAQQLYQVVSGEVAKARNEFIQTTDEALSQFKFLSAMGSEMPAHYRNFRDTLLHTVFEVRIPSLLEKLRQGDLSAQKKIENVIKLNANAFKEQYMEAIATFRDMGAVSTLTFRAVSGLIIAAQFIGNLAIDKIKELVDTAFEEYKKDPVKALSVGAVVAGGLGILALGLFLRSRR